MSKDANSKDQTDGGLHDANLHRPAHSVDENRPDENRPRRNGGDEVLSDATPRILRIAIDRLVELAFTLAITVATIVNVYVANRQWNAMIDSNRINNTSFVAAQRPYMYYDGINYLKDEIAPGVYRFSISPKIGNSGNTPTRDLTVKVNCWLDPKAEGEPFDDFENQNIERQSGFYGPHAILQAIECHYTSDQAKAIKNGKLHSYMAADIRYKDFIDPNGDAREHVTQFALEFMIANLDETGGGLIGGVAMRGRHNCADESCPR